MTLTMQERARRKRALFRLRGWRALGGWLTLFLLLGLDPAQAAPQCGADHIDRHVRVRYVYDGDTVTLQDGQRLRLIGIDTPERGRDGKPDQPFALAARDAVRALLKGRSQLELRLDQTHHDHYGRLLAHAFLADGTSLSAWLLERGYGTLLIIPPDDWNAGCYAAAERHARAAGRGIWALPQYRPIASTALPHTARGYHLIKGRVIHVGNSRHSLWLDLEGKVAARIDRKDLGYFKDMDLPSLLHKEVIVRGWVHPHRDELQLRLRYATDLETVAP
jgi:endonuclease YncB( thermonuclease family)